MSKAKRLSLVKTIPIRVVEMVPARVVEMVPAAVVEMVPAAVVEMVPADVVEMVPADVVEMVPADVVEMVPAEVVEIVPLFEKAVADRVIVKNAAQRMDLKSFMSSPGGERQGMGRLEGLMPAKLFSFGPTVTNN
jgi:hypothetical protein